MRLDPLTTFILIIVIGIVAGLLFERIARPGWLTRQLAGPTRSAVTVSLVGIAGSFIGAHLRALLELGGGWLVLVVSAAAGAIIVLGLWRALR